MFIMIACLVAGVVLGLLARRHGKSIHTEKTAQITVATLIFFFGLSMGSRRDVLDSLPQLGAPALAIGLLGALGSTVVSLVYEKYFWRPNAGDDRCHLREGNNAESPSSRRWLNLLHTLKLPSILASGVLAGILFAIPEALSEGPLTLVLLALLVLQVGLGLGNRDDFRSILKGIDRHTFLLPLATVGGTLSFTLLALPLLPGSHWKEVLALGSGFGYYSLSSLLILDAKTATLGLEAATCLATLSLMANLVREVTALLFCGAIARRGRVMAAISVAGINSMDVCLPMISNTSIGRRCVPMALTHGIALEVSVPLLIGWLCI